jgi:hypothetical protein
MTVKQKLILFLISCDPGIRGIYKMVQIYDRADFPSKMTENLEPLLNDNLIFVSENFDNGTQAFAINVASRKTIILHCKCVETFYLCY